MHFPWFTGIWYSIIFEPQKILIKWCNRSIIDDPGGNHIQVTIIVDICFFQLDRIEALMKQLGLFSDEDIEEDAELVEDDIEAPSKVTNKTKPKTEQDLLDSFENMDLDDFKN